MRTFSPEFKALVIVEYRHGFKIQDFNAVFKINTRTIGKILHKASVLVKYSRLKGKKWFTYQDHLQPLIRAANIFDEWIHYKEEYGIFDLDAICKGERPP